MTRRSQSLIGRTVSPRALYLAALLVFGLLAFSESPFGPAPVSAANLTVTTHQDDLDDGDGCSLREAIENAEANSTIHADCAPSGAYGDDTITFAPGLPTIVLSGNLPDISDAAELTIDGGGDITIDGDDQRQMFEVNFEAELTLKGLMLTSAYTAGSGAAIDNEGIVNLIDTTVADSTAEVDGGGIYNTATLRMENSHVTNNLAGADHAGGDGGGINNQSSGTVIIEDGSSVNDNFAADDGGGIYNLGELRISESEVNDNTANNEINDDPSGDGGGIWNGGELHIDESSVDGNEANNGGGIFNESDDVTIHDSSISGNVTDGNGAGIYNADGVIMITETTIGGNIADKGDGGGIYNDQGHIEITDSLIGGDSEVEGNGATGLGGGIYTQQPDPGNSTVLITDTTIRHNNAGQGGGIYNLRDHVELTGSFVLDNVAAANGGGIATIGGEQNPDTLLISDSTISGNEATNGNGGGIHNFRDHVELFETSVTHNTAGNDGGGIFTQGLGVDATLIIDRSTISDNEAFSGGGLLNFGDVVTISNSTISGNEATGGGGGGIANTETVGHIDLQNVTIAFNESLQVNSGIYNDGPATAVTLVNTIVAENIAADCSGNGVTSVGHNLDSDGTCLLTTTNGDLPNAIANLGPLADNGGPTETHELLPGSEAIDAGDNPTCQVPPVDGEDQRGVERPFDGDNDGTAVCDIGAFEVSDEEDVDDDDPPNTPTPTPTRTATRTPVPTATSGASSLGGPIGSLFDAAGAARASRATPVPATAPASAPAQQPASATGGIRPPSTGDGGLER